MSLLLLFSSTSGTPIVPPTPPKASLSTAGARYTAEIRDQYGRLVTVLNRPMQKQFTLYRNKPGSCQFVMDLNDPQALPQNFQTSVYDVVLRRMGTPVFAGKISYLQPTVADDKKEVQVTATGYLDLLDYRTITPDFPNFDALHNKLPFSSVDTGQIAWSLINYTQFPTLSDGSALLDGFVTLTQSFVPQGTSTLKNIQLLLQNQNASGGIFIQIVNDNAGFPNGAVVPNSTQEIGVGTVPSTPMWITFDYTETAASLIQGQTYWIKIYLDTVQSAGNGILWSFLSGDYYTSGKAYSPENPTLFTSGQDLQFFMIQSDNSYQMTKNTYLGIQEGNINTSFPLSPSFDVYKKIKSAVEDMSTTFNGIDFATRVVIDQNTNFMTKFFDVYYPRIGIDNTQLNFSYPGNIKQIDKTKDGSMLYNEVVERGQGSGLSQIVVTVNSKASIQSFGWRQFVNQQSDVSDTGTLTSLGNEVLRVSSTPMDLPKIVLEGNKDPQLGSYGIGDTIKITISGPPLVSLVQSYRIEQIDVTVTDDDMEEITLTVSLA